MRQQITPALCVLAGVCSAAVAQEPPIWQTLDLASVKGQVATIYYEKLIAGDPQAALAAYEKFVRARQNQPDLMGKADAIIAEINELVGFEASEKMIASQKKMFSTVAMIRLAPTTLCLMKKSSLKAKLEQGAKLPNYSFDKADRTARLDFRVDANGNLPTMILLPANDDASLPEAVGTAAEMFGQSSPGAGAALHEVLEMAIMLRAQPPLSGFRWFSDGFANALAIHLLRKHAGEAEATEFLKSYDTSPYADMENQVNLRYWLGSNAEIEAPTPANQRLSHARYAYATTEAVRLIDAHGVEVVRAILEMASPVQSADSFLGAVGQVTGEDMRSRLERYQSFKTPQDGMALYSRQFNDAQGKKDSQAMLNAVLRLREVRPNIDFGDNIMVARLLQEMEYEKPADAAFDQALELAAKSNRPEVKLSVQKMFLQFCLVGKKYARAQSAADDVLLAEPQNVTALTAQMLHKATSGNLEQAKTIAESILKYDTDPKSQYVKAAKQVQAQPAKP